MVKLAVVVAFLVAIAFLVAFALLDLICDLIDEGLSVFSFERAHWPITCNYQAAH